MDIDMILRIPREWHEVSVPLFHSVCETVVADYSKRNLTYGRDKLVALSGIANRLQDVTAFRYLAGL